MKALVYEAPGKGKITDIPMPVCGEDDVIIKVESCGICKWSELAHNSTGTSLAKYPCTPGHEFAGTVYEKGKNVTAVEIGDAVTVDNASNCGDCYYCRNDQSLYCENFASIGHNIQGGFAEYVKASKDKVFLIPGNLSFDEATVTEPVACAVHCMDVLDAKTGENVLVLGVGPHGLILGQLCHHSNAQKAVTIGGLESKLQIIRECGVPVIKMDRKDYSIHEEAIKKEFPHGVDAIIDTTGYWPLVQSVFRFLKKGGRFIQYGSYHSTEDFVIPPSWFNEIHYNEQKYIGVSCQTFCFDRALAYMANGKVKVDQFITHKFSLDDYFEALEANRTDREAIKVIINP